ncbi:MAG TPA: hypothetical protein VGY77_09540, partial [Gemmataceae bacterium]|nr:hypothetical protein [Gemmataceae bacterium]
NAVTIDGPGINTLDIGGPLDFNVGDVFWAALLIRGMEGPNNYPFFNGAGPLGHSYFDVGGPNESDPYDKGNTSRATILGGIHPVVGLAQDAGNLHLRVNATQTP